MTWRRDDAIPLPVYPRLGGAFTGFRPETPDERRALLIGVTVPRPDVLTNQEREALTAMWADRRRPREAA